MGSFKITPVSSLLRSPPWPAPTRLEWAPVVDSVVCHSGFPSGWRFTLHQLLEVLAALGLEMVYSAVEPHLPGDNWHPMMWAIQVQPPCLKWDNPHSRTPHGISRGLYCNCITVQVSLSPSSSLPHRYCPWKHSPKSLMHPNLRDSESVSQRVDQWQHLSLVPPHPHVILSSPHS